MKKVYGLVLLGVLTSATLVCATNEQEGNTFQTRRLMPMDPDCRARGAIVAAPVVVDGRAPRFLHVLREQLMAPFNGQTGKPEPPIE